MFDVFGQIKEYVKYKPKVTINDAVFKLHYKFTFTVLLACSIVVTSRQYIGDPIDCIVDEIPLNIMDTYCWIYSTFTVPEHFTGRIGLDIVQPGVGFHSEDDNVKHHRYYQWVAFVLIFQAFLFYVPHYLWKSWELGRIENLVLDLHTPIVEDDVKAERINTITSYFSSYIKKHDHYALKYFICELLNLINVIFQIFLVDYFLDGEFSSYGLDVFKFCGMDPEERIDPMSQVFPKVTKCSFNKYGPSGTVQKFDGLCVLPVNIINEKIYVFLWFWFVILSIISAVNTLYRFAWIASKPIRIWSIKSRCLLAKPTLVGKILSGRSKSNEKDDVPEKIKQFCNLGKFGDDFLLYQIGLNIDPGYFDEIIQNLDKVLNSKKNDEEDV